MSNTQAHSEALRLAGECKKLARTYAAHREGSMASADEIQEACANMDAAINRLATLAQQPAQGAAEPVAWQYRWTNPGDNPHASAEDVAWKEVGIPNLHMQTLQERVRELEVYRFDGKPCYEVRPLYAHPRQPEAQTSPRDDYEAGDSFAGYGEDTEAQTVVPAGWKLVPVEPTDAMCASGCLNVPGEWETAEGGMQDMRDAWSAMLAEAPAAAQSAEAGPEVRGLIGAVDALLEAHADASRDFVGWCQILRMWVDVLQAAVDAVKAGAPSTGGDK